MRESVPKKVDKKSGAPWRREEPGVPEEEKGVWGSQGGEKNKLVFFFFFSTLFCLNITTMYLP